MVEIPGLLCANCSFCGRGATFAEPVWLVGITLAAICAPCLQRAFKEIGATSAEMTQLSQEPRERRVVVRVFRGNL